MYGTASCGSSLWVLSLPATIRGADTRVCSVETRLDAFRACTNSALALRAGESSTLLTAVSLAAGGHGSR